MRALSTESNTVRERRRPSLLFSDSMFSDVMLSVRFVSNPLPFTLFTISLCTFFSPFCFWKGVCMCSQISLCHGLFPSAVFHLCFLFFFLITIIAVTFFFCKNLFHVLFLLLLLSFYFSSQRRQLRQRPNCTCSTHTHTCIHRRAQCLHVHRKKKESESNEPSVITHTQTHAKD